ncbi:MAG TPA: DUF2877 domain-containing protein [Burkholderiales bacterium]|nr:DUF2877 domain-containing protein [Burkholderiales bacterium]
MSYAASVVGRYAREAGASGAGEVRAVFRRSFYLRFPGGRYACVGDPSLGGGPLNALVPDFRMASLGERVELDIAGAKLWTPTPLSHRAEPDLRALQAAARGRVPSEGLGCLVVDAHNSLSGHAQPALDAIERWLVGNALDDDAQALIGLGPGLTPSGDDYLGGVLIALHQLGREAQARGLWRWLEPRLRRTSAISAAHLAAGAAGEGHEVLHACLQALHSADADWPSVLAQLDNVGHCSGWDSLAGLVAVAKLG